MYTNSITNEDCHINNSSDMELITVLAEAKGTPRQKSNCANDHSFAKAVGKTARDVGVGLAVAGATKAASDYANYGDPLYSVKEGHKKFVERRNAAKAERELEEKRKEIADDFKKWQEEQAEKKKQKLLKEECVFFIDEAAGTAYYPFIITEGVFKKIRDLQAENRARTPVMQSLQPDFNKACTRNVLSKYVKPMDYDMANEVFELMFNVAEYASDNKLDLSNKRDRKKVEDLFKSLAKQVEHAGYDPCNAFGNYIETPGSSWWSAYFEPAPMKFETARKNLQSKGGA